MRLLILSTFVVQCIVFSATAQISFDKYARETFGSNYLEYDPTEYDSINYDDVYPYDPLGHLQRGLIKQQDGHLAEALKDFNESIAWSEQCGYCHYIRAHCHNEMENDSLAIIDLRKAIYFDPTLPEPRNFISWYYGLENKQDSAIYQLEKAIEYAPSDPYAYYNLALIYLENRKTEQKAVRFFKKSTKVDPEFTIGLYMVGLFDFLDDNLIAALRHFEKVIDLNPDFSQCYFWKGLIMTILDKKNSKVIPVWNKAIELEPEMGKYRWFRGLLHLEDDNYSAAMEDFIAANQLTDPNRNYYGPKPTLERKQKDLDHGVRYYANNRFLMSLKVRAIYEEAICMMMEERYNKARTLLKEVIAIKPNLSVSYFLKGLCHEYLKNYEEAIRLYDKAIELDNNLYDAYKKRGMLAQDFEDYDLAIAHYNKMIELDSAGVVPYRLRGQLQMILNEIEPAVKDLSVYLDINAKNTNVLFNRAIGYKLLAEYDSAIVDFTRIIEQRPWDREAYYERAICWNYLGEPLKIIENCDSALLYTDYNEELTLKFLAFRGAVKKSIDDYSGALEDFNQVLKIEPENALILTERAEIKMLKKYYFEARADLDQAIKLDDSDAKTYYLRAKIYKVEGDLEKACQNIKLALKRGWQIKRKEYDSFCE